MITWLKERYIGKSNNNTAVAVFFVDTVQNTIKREKRNVVLLT